MRYLLLGTLGLLAAGTLVAQQPKEPDLGYIYPAGTKQGGVIEVTIGGQQLSKVEQARISGEGVKVSLLGYKRPLDGKRTTEIREMFEKRRKEIVEDARKKGKRPFDPEVLLPFLQDLKVTEEEAKLFLEERQKKNDPKRQPNRQLDETVRLRIEADANAKPGPRTLRLIGKNGVSAPLSFMIGTHPEVLEPLVQIQEFEKTPPQPLKVAFPIVLNGQILPGETDRYEFEAKAGEEIVFVGQARELIPYLADAVPGWFQMVLTVVDSNGHEVAEAQCFRYSPDPVLLFKAKQAGTYRLEVRDSIHRGREDFVYRVTAGKIPFVTGIFPLGAPAGTKTTLELSGWNLPKNRITITAPGEPGVYPGLISQASGALFESGTGAEIRAAEPDNDPEHAAAVKTPTVINGRIDKPGDVDVFAVRAAKGKPLVVEVMARRLGSPVDGFLRITNAAGREVARADDQEDLASGLLTHHADSRILFEPPADGTYYVSIGDAQQGGGPDFVYRLRISPPDPGFALRVSPSAITGQLGENMPISLHAFRRDGFAGEIQVACETPGFTLAGGRIPPGTDSVAATLTFPTKAEPGAILPLVVKGSAEIGGKRIEHLAEPADDMLQAFFYHHLVPTGELLANIPADSKPRPALAAPPGMVRLVAGQPTVIKASAPQWIRDRLHEVTAVNAPEGITVTDAKAVKDAIEITLLAEAKIAPVAGNLLLSISAANPDKANPAKLNSWVVGHFPAIPFQIEKAP